jgi:starch phosphorylase
MNVLSIIHRYKQLKKMTPEERKKVVPRVCVIGGKAASGDFCSSTVFDLCLAVFLQ